MGENRKQEKKWGIIEQLSDNFLECNGTDSLKWVVINFEVTAQGFYQVLLLKGLLTLRTIVAGDVKMEIMMQNFLETPFNESACILWNISIKKRNFIASLKCKSQKVSCAALQILQLLWKIHLNCNRSILTIIYCYIENVCGREWGKWGLISTKLKFLSSKITIIQKVEVNQTENTFRVC